MPNVGSHLVERELWEAVQERFAENKARASRNRKTDYLFTGRMKCDACKGAYIDCHGERGYERRFYTCRGRSRVVDQCSMPVFRERDIDAEVWPWIKEIATHFERVEATLAQRQADADEQNTRINALIANTDRLIVQKKEEQALVLGLFKKHKLPEDRWEVEDAICEGEIVSHQADREKLVAKMVKPHYMPEYLADVRDACRRISEGIEYFDVAEKRETYELLELSLQLEVKDGSKLVRAECVLGRRLLTLG